MAATSSQQSKVRMQTVLYSSCAFQDVVSARNTSFFVSTSSCPVQELHSGNWYSSNSMICLSRYFDFGDVSQSGHIHFINVQVGVSRHYLCRCPQILIVAAVVDFGIALVNGESGAK
jgi:hypothetical protein